MWKARLSELEFNEQELAAVLETIDSEWITAGPRTQSFEKTFVQLIGVEHAVAVSNGTAALFLALKAAGIGPGTEVLCPSITFLATAAAVIQCGGRPVFVDIVSLENPTMCPRDAARKITPRTRAILPVHYAGIPAEMDELLALASAHGLKLIEDAARAPGAYYRGRAYRQRGVLMAAPKTSCPDRRDMIWIDCNPQAGREMKDMHPLLVLSPKEFNERTEIVIGLPLTTAAFNDTNPFGLKLKWPKGVASYILGHQPKSFDWRARNAKPHPLKKVPEDAYALACETLNQIIEIG